jgi:hypothetical protein
MVQCVPLNWKLAIQGLRQIATCGHLDQGETSSEVSVLLQRAGCLLKKAISSKMLRRTTGLLPIGRRLFAAPTFEDLPERDRERGLLGNAIEMESKEKQTSGNCHGDTCK